MWDIRRLTLGVGARRGKIRAMAKLSTIDLKYIDRAFGMSSGYVLDLSNATFAEFFKREFAIDIYDDAYGDLGTSKGKHFRSFLLKAHDTTAARVLRGLWEYKEATNADAATKELGEKILGIANKLDGKTADPVRPGPKPAVSSATYRSLHARMQELLPLPAQQRGYKFESFLKDAFNAFELQSKEAFRIAGEQIDGSFLLGHEVYSICSKRGGATPPRTSPISIRSTASSNRRLLGRADCSSAMRASHLTGWRLLVAARSWSVWMDSTCSKRSRARFRYKK